MLRRETQPQQFDPHPRDFVHQQRHVCRLRNFLASTHSSCWFSRASAVVRNLFSGCCVQRFCKNVRPLTPTPSPASFNSGFISFFAPVISANGNPNSRQCGSTAFSTSRVDTSCD